MSRSAKGGRFSIGIEGEDIALEYFAAYHYSLVKRRYKTQFGEIDLILRAPNDNLIVFVEVKVRQSILLYNEEISSLQRHRIQDAVECFMMQHGQYLDFLCRIDVIIVVDGSVLRHIENAWDAGG